MDYKPKSHGISYLRNLVSRAKNQPFTKHISLSMPQAEEIISELERTKAGEDLYSLKSNSLKAGALILCIDPKELRERLIHPKPSQVMTELCEARNKIKMLEDIGDSMFLSLAFSQQKEFESKWVITKKLFRK